MRKPVDVLLLTDADDPHAAVVTAELCARGATAATKNLGSVTVDDFTVNPGDWVEIGDVHVDRNTTVWYRRLGKPVNPAAMGALEARLREEELEELFLGGLDAAGVRWVDRPDTVERAEHKLYQLAVARRLGVPVPVTTATNRPAVAARFLDSGPVLAKAASSGIGLAPYAGSFEPDDLDRVPAAPTLLQRQIAATADIRVVVVGAQAWAWRRCRRGLDPVDWRAADPQGQQFQLTDGDTVTRPALTVATGLELNMCIQDWVDDGRQTWFLEANPVGQWLFLDHAQNVIAPALANHLLGTGR